MFWPSEEMRAKGGRSAWKDWLPCIGMVGYVVHFWMPGHRDPLFRSPFSRVVYLVAMNGYYVPVGEFGIREYDPIRDGDDGLSEEEEMATAAAGVLVAMRAVNARRSSVQHELHELDELQLQQRERLRGEGLTPILGSSLESPTSHLMGSSVLSGVGADVDAYTYDDAKVEEHAPLDAVGERASVSGATPIVLAGAIASGNVQMRAVSSSSSEDEAELLNYEMQRREQFFNMWKMMSEHKDAELKQAEQAKREERAEALSPEPAAVEQQETTAAQAHETGIALMECAAEERTPATPCDASASRDDVGVERVCESELAPEAQTAACVTQLEQQTLPECSDV